MQINPSNFARQVAWLAVLGLAVIVASQVLTKVAHKATP